MYWIKYGDINSARVAKRKLDNRSFFGSNLHVCYAPEYESVQDTRDKLLQRKKIILQKTRDSVQQRGCGASDSKQRPVPADRANPPPQTHGVSGSTPEPSCDLPGLPRLPALPFPPHSHPMGQPYSSMKPFEATDIGMSGKRKLVGGCEGEGGSGYKPAGLSTSDRVSLYMESKSTEGTNMVAMKLLTPSTTSLECKVS